MSRLQGFGLQIGSEVFLVIDPGYRHRLERLSDEISGTVTMLASFVVDNDTTKHDHAAVGTYQFTDTALGIGKYVVNGEQPFSSTVIPVVIFLPSQDVIALRKFLGICRPLHSGRNSLSFLHSL